MTDEKPSTAIRFVTALCIATAMTLSNYVMRDLTEKSIKSATPIHKKIVGLQNGKPVTMDAIVMNIDDKSYVFCDNGGSDDYLRAKYTEASKIGFKPNYELRNDEFHF